MNIQQLQYYLILCQEKNITEAGISCGLTQSALSKQIQKLERELDTTLIKRNTRKFELTENGILVEQYAEEMLKIHEEMLASLHSVREIRIGSMPVLAPYHFTRLFTEFSEKYPDIRLSLSEQPADRILADIKSYDFVILRSILLSDTKNYCSQILNDDVLCAVVYESHPLAGRESIFLSELRDETFIFPEKMSGGYEAFYKSCLLAGFEPRIQYQFPQTYTVFNFVKEKAGVTLNFSKVCREFARSGVKTIPLKDNFHYTLSMFYPRGRRLPEPHRTFLNFMKEKTENF